MKAVNAISFSVYVVIAVIGLQVINVLISAYVGGWMAQYISPPYGFQDVPVLKGKIAIVTGSNIGGIGFSTARELARKGATVILACRSLDKGMEAQALITKELEFVDGAGKAEYIQLDLTSFNQIQQFSRTFKSKYRQLDMLILNAGVVMCPYEETLDGFEMQLGVNYLGHFLLTKLLMKMIKSSKARVVHVGSESNRDTYVGGIRLDSFKNDSLKYSRL